MVLLQQNAHAGHASAAGGGPYGTPDAAQDLCRWNLACCSETDRQMICGGFRGHRRYSEYRRLLLARGGVGVGGGGTAHMLQQYLLSSVPNQVRKRPSSLLNGACNRTRLQHRADKSQRATLTFARLEFQPDICERPSFTAPQTFTKGWGSLSVRTALAASAHVTF